jgi:hypothetical protein
LTFKDLTYLYSSYTGNLNNVLNAHIAVWNTQLWYQAWLSRITDTSNTRTSKYNHHCTHFFCCANRDR